MMTNDDLKDIEPTQDSLSDPESGDDLVLNEYHPKRTKKFIILVACVAAFGGLIFGYDIAGAGATFVMTGFKQHFKWECPDDAIDCTDATSGTVDRDKGLINGLFGTGATIGAFINPYFAEKYGRKPALSFSSVVFIIGAGIQTYAPVMTVMWVGRVFSGMGIGMLSMCAPVYIGECSPEHTRGALGTLWQLAITAGIVIASAANLGLKEWDQGWRLSYGGNIIFAIIMLICLVFMPESPRWLAAHSTEEETRKALSRVRFDDEIELEMAKLKHEVEEERKLGVAPLSELFSKKNLMGWRLTLATAYFGFQQMSGINAVMFYAPDILNTFFTESQAIVGTFILNLINCLSTFITVVSIDRFGRTKLLVIGGLMMFPCLLLCGILASVDQTMGVGYGVLTCSAFYIISFAFSWVLPCGLSPPKCSPTACAVRALGLLPCPTGFSPRLWAPSSQWLRPLPLPGASFSLPAPFWLERSLSICSRWRLLEGPLMKLTCSTRTTSQLSSARTGNFLEG